MEYYIYILIEDLPQIYGGPRIVKAFWNEDLALAEAERKNGIGTEGEFIVEQTTIARSPEE